jgi:hypothetical protein
MIALGAVAAGTAVKTGANYAAGQTNANTLDANARLADQAAGDAVIRGRFAEGKTRMDGSRLAAKQTVAYGAAGVDAGVGSPLDVLNDTSLMTEQDAQMHRLNASREAWGYESQATSMRKQAKNTRDAGVWGAFGDILGGAAKMADIGSRSALGGVSGQPTPVQALMQIGA